MAIDNLSPFSKQEGESTPLKNRHSKPPRHPRLRKGLGWVLLLLLAAALALLGVDRYVVESTRGDIRRVDHLPTQPVDAILVLGAGVRPDGSPSPMLRDRLDVGISLYHAGVSDRLLLSGDGRVPEEYDEPAAMKAYAISKGVPEEAIVLDKAGLSTYDSVCRANQIGGYQTVVLVTQQYHLHRALYVAKSIGMPSVGVPADLQWYRGQIWREVREVLARNKEVVQCLTAPAPVLTENAWHEPEKIR